MLSAIYNKIVGTTPSSEKEEITENKDDDKDDDKVDIQVAGIPVGELVLEEEKTVTVEDVLEKEDDELIIQNTLAQTEGRTLTEEEVAQAEADKFLRDSMKELSKIPNPQLAEMMFADAFKDKYPDTEGRNYENFSATIQLDNKNPPDGMVSLFVSRVHVRLQFAHLKHPDQMFLSLYGRKSGGSVSGRLDPKMKYCTAYAMKEFVCITNHGAQTILLQDHVSPPFEVSRTEKKKNMSGKEYISGQMNPVIPKNTTSATLQIPVSLNKKNGAKPMKKMETRGLLKNRSYMAHVVWCAWETDPVQSMQHIREHSELANLMAEIERTKI